jgi:hypothetical protein
MEQANYIFRILSEPGTLVSETRERFNGIGEALPHAAGLALEWARRGRQYHGGTVQLVDETGYEIARVPIVPADPR